MTSYTQTSADAKAEDGEEKPEGDEAPKNGTSKKGPEEGGRPKKKEEEKAD